jgi:hypothetical protein
MKTRHFLPNVVFDNLVYCLEMYGLDHILNGRIGFWSFHVIFVYLHTALEDLIDTKNVECVEDR